MGRRSREHRERREKRLRERANRAVPDPDQADRCRRLEEELTSIADGDAVFWKSPDLSPDAWEENLEDILAFESVSSGVSLFEGLQERGLDLPPPEKLDEDQSLEKVREIVQALARLKIVLIGYDEMEPRELYSTLWNQTLWEGCYVQKRHPGALTLMDVSHRLSRSEILAVLDEIIGAASVH